MNGRISSILQGTNDLAQSMNMVSHAVEEMTTFSAGVAEKSSSAADVASKADILAERASDTVSALGDAAKSIGDVVALIKSIASQTNLLALNATIEASAAGEFGKGFAIVASEVKALAQQTAAATEEIEQRIGNIQLSSKDTASILSEITGVIGNISSSISAIKDISHEQSRTTNEVSKCITDAVTGTIGVRCTIEQLSTDANDIALGASQTAARANEVGENMKVLSGETLNSANRAQSTRDAAEDLMQISSQLSTAVQRYRS
jgi:methyl-accepting chemotaxis protein